MLRFATSARKHRIGKARALEEIANAESAEPTVTRQGDEAIRYYGIDSRGLLLEIVVVPGVEYDLVIHVMPAHYRGNKP